MTPETRSLLTALAEAAEKTAFGMRRPSPVLTESDLMMRSVIAAGWENFAAELRSLANTEGE